jgi:hypothetical protein
VLRLDAALDGWETVGVWQPELIQGFGVGIGGDKLGSRIIACLYPAAWPGVVNADFVHKEDRIVGGFGPLLGAIALAERLAGVGRNPDIWYAWESERSMRTFHDKVNSKGG